MYELKGCYFGQGRTKVTKKHRYTIDIFGILEFGDTAEGPAFLETQDIYPESFWTYVSVLVGVFFGFRLLAGISLKRSSRYLF